MPNTSYSQTAPYTSPVPCIAILGRKEKTGNYEKFLSENGFSFLTTLDPEAISSCSGLLLPGGGDITPAFFGEKNKGYFAASGTRALHEATKTRIGHLQRHAAHKCRFRRHSRSGYAPAQFASVHTLRPLSSGLYRPDIRSGPALCRISFR